MDTELSNDYDVCLSFAGEDRPFVEGVAEFLRDYNVKVFYDDFLAVELWGRDLYQDFSEIYQNARYAVVFISSFYEKKYWTNHELKACQARAFKDKDGYILPVRFDDTNIPGILDTCGYMDAREKSPDEIARAIIYKLGTPTPSFFFSEDPYFITFKNMDDFNIWNNDVAHIKGYPLYGKRGDKIAYDAQRTERWCDPIHNNDYVRIAASVKEKRLPIEMVDDAAKRKYGFVRRDRNEILQMGFIGI